MNGGGSLRADRAALAVAVGAAVSLAALLAANWYRGRFGPVSEELTVAEGSGYEILRGEDMLIVICAGAAAVLASLDLRPLAVLAAAVAVAVVVLKLFDSPGPENDFGGSFSYEISLLWGAWASLAASLVLLGATLTLAREARARMSWLDPNLAIPERVELDTGEHLRPMDAADVDLDYPAVMGSRRRLWEKYGDAWGWPVETMSYEADREDLARHAAEIGARESFLYGVFDEGETRLLGCLYIDPPEPDAPEGADATVSWWLVDEAVGTPLERELEQFAPRWLAKEWGFDPVHYYP